MKKTLGDIEKEKQQKEHQSKSKALGNNFDFYDLIFYYAQKKRKAEDYYNAYVKDGELKKKEDEFK